MNLGVISDADCNLQKHLSNISKTAFNQLRDGSKVRRLLPRSDSETLVYAFIPADYCNELFAGLQLCVIRRPRCSDSKFISGKIIESCPTWFINFSLNVVFL